MASIFDNGGYIGFPDASYGEFSVVSNGLILALDAGDTKSYPGTGSTWFDLSGNGNDATLYNSPTWTADNQGTFTFNGTNQYAQVPAGFANFTGGITIFSIVNMGVANNYERIIDFGNGAPSNNILLTRNTTTTTLNFEYYNGATRTVFLSVANAIANSAIRPYAVTANGSNIIMYGRSATTGSLIQFGSIADTDLPPNVTRNNCYIGRSNWPADAYFQTTMHVILIYNRALSFAELAQNYNAYRRRYGL